MNVPLLSEPGCCLTYRRNGRTVTFAAFECVATKPVDFRKGHDGLAALVKNELNKDPFTGTVFVSGHARRTD